jgi:uncharacterized membrane protein
VSGRSFLSGVAVGAGLVWLLDPAHGARRRAALRDRADELLGPALPLASAGLAALPGALRTRAGDIEALGAHAGRSAGGRRRVPPTAALTTAAGGVLALYGVRRGGITGRALRAAGTSILAAGLRELDARAGEDRRRALDVQRTLDVSAPPERAFAFWSDVTNFPRFMPQVRTVHDLGDGRARWTVADRDGASVAWVTAVSALVPGRLLAWASEPGSAVRQVGAVRVAPRGTGSRVAVRLCFAPQGPAGDVAVAGLLGDDPLTAIHAVFERAKAMLDEDTSRSTRP